MRLFFVYLLLPIALAGCSSLINFINTSSSDLVSAKPLGEPVPNQTCANVSETATINTKLTYIGQLISESEQNCSAFLNRVTADQSGINIASDFTSTTLTALGAVFTPLGTVHALAAGATVVTSTKSSIASNLYAKASAQNFYTALNRVYYTSIKNYQDQLNTVTDTSKLNVCVERSKIITIHSMCALAPTEQVINDALQAVAPGAASGSSTDGGVPPTAQQSATGVSTPAVTTQTPPVSASDASSGATASTPAVAPAPALASTPASGAGVQPVAPRTRIGTSSYIPGSLHPF